MGGCASGWQRASERACLPALWRVGECVRVPPTLAPPPPPPPGVVWGWCVAGAAFAPYALYVLAAAPFLPSLAFALLCMLCTLGPLVAVDRAFYGQWTVGARTGRGGGVGGGGDAREHSPPASLPAPPIRWFTPHSPPHPPSPHATNPPGLPVEFRAVQRGGRRRQRAVRRGGPRLLPPQRRQQPPPRPPPRRAPPAAVPARPPPRPSSAPAPRRRRRWRGGGARGGPPRCACWGASRLPTSGPLPLLPCRTRRRDSYTWPTPW